MVRYFCLFILITALLAAVAAQARQASPTDPIDVYSAFDGKSQWLNVSRPLTAQDLKGRILLLDFWTYACINCMQVIPDLHYFEKKFGKALTIIGIHSGKFTNEKDSENIRQALLRHGITHPVVNDADAVLWKAFGVRAWPTFGLIGPEGRVVSAYSGEGHREVLERDIAKLQKQYAAKRDLPALPLKPEKQDIASALRFPGKLDVIPDYAGGQALAISDSGNHRILIVDRQGSILRQFGSKAAGLKDGTAGEARFRSPQGVLYGNGYLYVADTGNHALRRITLASGQVETLAGTGEKGSMRIPVKGRAKTLALASPWDLAFFPDERHIVIAMAGAHQLWSYSLDDQMLTAIAGNGAEALVDGVFPVNMLAQPSGLSAFGGSLYFVDAETSALRTMTSEHNQVSTLIGTGLFDFGYKEGPKEKARMQHPLGVHADESGVYVADAHNHAVRRYDPKTSILSNLAGMGKRGVKDGAGKAARFSEPGDIARIGDTLYIADTNNHRIRTLDLATGKVGTLEIKKAP